MENINTNGKKIKILIVEDTESNYELMKTLFRNYDYDLALNGKEAVELAGVNNYSIIIMDIKMPVMNGLEATKEIRKFNKEIPIIAVTAYAYGFDREASLAAGCTEHITKPLKVAELREIMVRYCSAGV